MISRFKMQFHPKITLLSFLRQFAYYMYSISQSGWRILERIYKDSFQDGIRVILKVDAFLATPSKEQTQVLKKITIPLGKPFFYYSCSLCFLY